MAVVDFYLYDEEYKEILKYYQIRTDIIPMIGCQFAIDSSRDEEGNYRTKENDPAHMGKIENVLEGVVKNVSYLFEESGDCSQRYQSTTYVVVHLLPIRKENKDEKV